MPTTLASVDSLLERLKKVLPSLNAVRCQKALAYARDTYGERQLELLEGVSLLEHAVRSAELLAEFCPDEDAIVACILQHALKVPDHPPDALADEFGRAVRDMVSRVHLLSHLHTSDWHKSIDDMRIMLVSISDDIRILLIALAIECHSMDNLAQVRPEYRTRLCRQSLQLFAPISARLGIYALKYRLEKEAFAECYPTDAVHIDGQLEQLHGEHGMFLDRTVDGLRKFLLSEGIAADVLGREKQPYSIFQKMRTKSVTGIGKINDLFAIRVVVPILHDCYQALGLIHRISTPILHRFKDYISFPKPNGYQSLHTCVIGLPDAPRNVVIEVQIRTPSMHREAEYGIAAHWLYKAEGKCGGLMHSISRSHLTDVLLRQHSTAMRSEVDATDAGIRLVDHIYVLTPKGDIIELPDGGTPLDFAFTLHTDLGLRFKAARVNGGIVPISHKLENGDVVEILMHKHPRPSLQWLKELATPSARSKLKAYFFSQNRTQFLHIPPGRAPRVTPRTVKGRAKASATKKKKDLLMVEGTPLNLPYRFAKCCVPDEHKSRSLKLIGMITRDGVINVHRDECHMVKAANPERRVTMKWN